MTLAQAMMEADELRPNAYTEDQKARWLTELDGKVCTEILKVPTVSPYRPEGNPEIALLVPPPYDNIYCFYLCAMMDFYNLEMDNYADSMRLFNSAWGEYARYYRRGHLPPSASIQNVM